MCVSEQTDRGICIESPNCLFLSCFCSLIKWELRWSVGTCEWNPPSDAVFAGLWVTQLQMYIWCYVVRCVEPKWIERSTHGQVASLAWSIHAWLTKWCAIVRGVDRCQSLGRQKQAKQKEKWGEGDEYRIERFERTNILYGRFKRDRYCLLEKLKRLWLETPTPVLLLFLFSNTTLLMCCHNTFVTHIFVGNTAQMESNVCFTRTWKD